MAVSRGLCVLLLALPALAQVPTPVEDLKAHDYPGDDGTSILLSWNKMPYDGQEGVFYVVEGAEEGKELAQIIQVDSTSAWSEDIKLPFWLWSRDRERHAFEVKSVGGASVEKGKTYRFSVTTLFPGGRSGSQTVSGAAEENWFDSRQLNNLVLLILFFGVVFLFINLAKTNPNMFLRRIAGLDAIEEAIGRATEMGRPLYYMTGLYGMDAIQTIASSVILGQVARRVAEYDTQLRVPHRDPVVFSVCQEVVKEAYAKAGRPDAYKEDYNFFLTQDQFSYTAAVDGMMVRERPAAIFYMGYFLAESLLLAEVGATTGAIQVAGTDVASQLPFFVTACDYTLIGEELYAASAYLSREPVLVGTLRGQDVGKLLTLVALAAGTVLALFKVDRLLDLLRDFS
ncbi:MAG: fibronectin type III domain-containing protein [Planctomycetes bacterium]|nr:fibronectin type III domain-containing protein [Planctomycetota bacterium]